MLKRRIELMSYSVITGIRQIRKPPFIVKSLVIAVLASSQTQIGWAADAVVQKEEAVMAANETADAANPSTDASKPADESQPSPDAGKSADDMEEVVVSATKSTKTLSNSPAAVTVINRKDIDARNVSRLGDALTKVPSLYLGFNAFGQTQGGSGSGVFSLRGLNTQRTLVLMDGQPLQDGNSQSVNWRTVMTDDIERVKVVPGAFSSLYGSSAMGGVINVLSKAPVDHELTIRGKKGFEDANGQDASIYFRDKFSNGWGFTGGFGYQDRAGYQNTFANSAVTPGVTGTPVTGGIPSTTTTGLPSYITGVQGASKWTQLNASGKVEYTPNDQNRFWGAGRFQTSAWATTLLPLICKTLREPR